MKDHKKPENKKIKSVAKNPSMKINIDNTGINKNSSKTISNYGKKDGLIVAKIDNIYLSIKDAPKYYTRLTWMLFFFNLFNTTIIWVMLSMIGPMKNKYYCLDIFSREFKVCDQNEFCQNTHYGIKYVVFTADPKIANISLLNETYNINNNFLNYFLKEGVFYSLNNAKFDRYKEVDSLYTIVFAITANENFNFQNAFHQYCNKQVVTVQLALVSLISLSLGNFILGFFADIYGRKPLLIFIGIKQFIGCGLLFIITTIIINSGRPEGDTYVSPYQSFQIHSENETIIDTFLKQTTTYTFDNLESKMNENFNYNNQLFINSKAINTTFSKYKFIFFLALAIVLFSSSASHNICLAFLLENSINDSEIYSKYLIMNYAIPLSFLIQFILTSLCNNFHLPFLIIGCCLLLNTILLFIFSYESPRHNYEYFEYGKITSFFEKIVDKEILEKFYRSEDHPKIKKELQKQPKDFYFCEIIFNKSLCLGYNKRIKRYADLIYRDKFQDIQRFNFIRNPKLMFLFIYRDKIIKQNLLIIISLISIVGLIFYLTINKFNLPLILSREDLYNNKIVNSVSFYLTLTIFVSFYIFHFILKFFGFNIILFICFSFIFIFSLIYELISLGRRTPEDMNKYVFNSIHLIYDTKGTSLIVMVFFVTFFAAGLFSVMFFYLTKLTKTLYRCTFYAIFKTILDFAIIFSNALSQYFEKNFFYVSVLCVIGFVNTYFIKEDVDFNIIGDYRKIELEDDD